MVVFLIFLFIVLTPGQLITLPSIESSQMSITITHAVIFGVIWHFAHPLIEKSKLQINV